MPPLIYVSSTEHSKELREFGISSTLPETHGCDVLVLNGATRVGFQRKEASDFMSSITDGRLAKELGQIESSSLLTHAVLILEGDFDWTTDGQSTIRFATLTRPQFRSLITGVQLRGVVVLFSEGISDTIRVISSTSNYLSKPRHSSLSQRPNAKSNWGTRTSKSFALHLLQSFPGIGVEMGERIFQHFGYIPLEWSCNESELSSIPGIGTKTASRLIKALTRNEPQ